MSAQPAQQQAPTKPRNTRRPQSNNSAATPSHAQQAKEVQHDNKTNGNGRKHMNKDKKFKPREHREPRESNVVYVGKLNVEELVSGANGQMASHYKDMRLKCIYDTFREFGQIENINEHLESGFVLISLPSIEIAKTAITTLADKEEANKLMAKRKAELNAKKLPGSLCPDFTRLRISFSETKKSSKKEASKTAKVKAETSQANGTAAKGPKVKTAASVVAGVKAEAPVEAAPAPAAEKPQRKGKKAKQPAQEAAAATPAAAPAPAPKPTPAPKVDSDSLRREAEKARLLDEQKYLTTQQETVRGELAAERGRCTARDTRIKVLIDDLNRVQQEAERIQRQLTAEQNWKQAAADRVAKFEEELTHMAEEQTRVEQRLAQIQNSTTSTSWADTY